MIYTGLLGLLFLVLYYTPKSLVNLEFLGHPTFLYLGISCIVAALIITITRFVFYLLAE
jgi:hypothetical protein